MDPQISTAFNRFYELITPSRQQVEKALVYARAISEDMSNVARGVASHSFTRYRLIGSYARETAILEFSDVDVMLEFQGARELGLGASRPLLTGIRDSLEQSASTAVRISEMQEVVQIEYPDGVHLDILPALRDDSQGYFIPDGTNGWRTTDPDVQECYFNGQNAASRIHLPKFTRGLKYWNAAHGSLIRSYHLESIVAQLAPQLDGDYSIASRETFEELSKTVCMSDPAGHQGELSSYLSASQRDAISALCRASTTGAIAALTAQGEGDFRAAMRIWSSVYGPLFSSDVPRPQELDS
ncbi:hypothetical protein OG418_26820 [Streptomyces phaeochromogenes]|uniref:SMODS domain-containing nucleotidyltransferase n=1 Tax=Streptomyces phaeochromogenes TaxID=1923 RepID=UPI00324EE344